jgi:hypothetical protein
VDGVSISWPYKFISTSGGYTNYQFFRDFGADEALLCAGQGSYSFGTLGTVCGSTKLTDCGDYVKTAGYVTIRDPNTEGTSCLIELNLYLSIGFKIHLGFFCALQPCSTSSQISLLFSTGTVFSCGAINYQFTINVKACEIFPDDGYGCIRTAAHYGATDGTVLVTVTA